VVRSDLGVAHFLDSVGGYRHPERRDRLLDLMDVDSNWRMHQVSDGERRRVQIVAGLMAPWQMLLLDEVTVDLDVLVRSRLLNFLAEECEQRGATILYATVSARRPLTVSVNVPADVHTPDSCSTSSTASTRSRPTSATSASARPSRPRRSRGPFPRARRRVSPPASSPR
jgi:ABC-type nitrate/sulfonate/bicarbonate transport system ATPase subunit